MRVLDYFIGRNIFVAGGFFLICFITPSVDNNLL